MAEHNELGREGEEEALFYLMRKGYTLLDHNWTTGHLEIDIIAEWWGEIVFVEVKTRRNENFAPAAEAVTRHKKRNLIAAAHAFLAQHGWLERPFRYDIITVIGLHSPFQITHIRNAYTEHEVFGNHRKKDEFQI